MPLFIGLLSAIVLIPAAVAGIVAGWRGFAANSGQVVKQVDQLIEIMLSLGPACCAVALMIGGLLLLLIGFVLLARGLQSGA